MKGICRNLERDKFVKQFQMFNKFLLVGVLLLPIFLSACSAKLGSIQTEDVDTLILQAEKAIKSAREVNAPSLAFEEFEQAETYLENAKDALNEHNGVEAIRFANQAITQARIARRKAVQNTMNAEFNATSLEKDALITELQKNIKTNKNRLTDLENRIQQFVETEKELQQNIRTLENEKRELANTERKHEQKVAELSETLKSIQAQSARSETEIRNYGNKVKDLSRKVDAAESMAKSESRQKRAAVAETESVKKQLREQANVYTKLLSEAKKRDVVAEHDEYIKQKKPKAYAFADQLQSNKPKRTGRTSLSTQQINAGKAALSKWEKAWSSKNVDAHLAFYSPNATVSKIIIKESKEHPTTLDRSLVETNLREMNAEPWKKTAELTEVEQESVIGTYRYLRLVSAAKTEDDTALYYMWIREIWVHQVQGKWKINRETWQIYENIPDLGR